MLLEKPRRRRYGRTSLSKTKSKDRSSKLLRKRKDLNKSPCKKPIPSWSSSKKENVRRPSKLEKESSKSSPKWTRNSLARSKKPKTNVSTKKCSATKPEENVRSKRERTPSRNKEKIINTSWRISYSSKWLRKNAERPRKRLTTTSKPISGRKRSLSLISMSSRKRIDPKTPTWSSLGSCRSRFLRTRRRNPLPSSLWMLRRIFLTKNC